MTPSETVSRIFEDERLTSILRETIPTIKRLEEHPDLTEVRLSLVNLSASENSLYVGYKARASVETPYFAHRLTEIGLTADNLIDVRSNEVDDSRWEYLHLRLEGNYQFIRGSLVRDCVRLHLTIEYR